MFDYVKKTRKAVRNLATQEQYVLVFQFEYQGTLRTFIVNRSFYGGEAPIRTVFSVRRRRAAQLIRQVFPTVKNIEHVFEPSKGLTTKTIIIVCQMPSGWELKGDDVLKLHIADLEIVKLGKPGHARIIEQACQAAQKKLAKQQAA